MLRKAGVDTSRVLRTGGVAALTFGQSPLGVSPSILVQQRRVVAAAAAPSCGACGQNLDLALVLADGSATGRVDPAYEAHAGPWATGPKLCGTAGFPSGSYGNWWRKFT